MKKRILSLVLIIILVGVTSGCNGLNDIDLDKDYNKFIKAVHYFGDESPLNFWSSDLGNISSDFEKIKRDGFNTLILVIPWREYQPQIDPISYNDQLKERIHFVINEANRLSLDVIVRIGYAWDYYYDGQYSIEERFTNIFTEESFLKAFSSYAEDVYKEVSKHENFISGFITWEDFWFISYIDGNGLDLQENLVLAKKLGFNKYLKEHYTIKELENHYDYKIESYNDAYLPGRDTYAYVLYFEFIDHFLIDKILESCQNVFPELTLETRFDMEPIKSGNNFSWFSHDYMHKVKNTSMVGTIYGPSMGFENDGRRKYASATEVLNKFEYHLKSWQKKIYPGQKLFIDQFLFFDNTPGFENNVGVEPDELGDFILNSKSSLEKYTSGYAIWTYKDYKANLLYNNGFELGDIGWSFINNALIRQENNNSYVSLGRNDLLTQQINQKHFYNLTNNLYIEINAKSISKASRIKVTIGDYELIVNLTNREWENYSIQVADNEHIEFNNLQIEVIEGQTAVDNLKLYSFIQESKLYDTNNHQLEMTQYIQELNNKLPDKYLKKEIIKNNNSTILENWQLKYEIGFYEKESNEIKEQIWMNRYGKIIFNKDEVEKEIIINAYVPFENLRKANNIDKVTIGVYSKDEKIENIEIRQNEEIQIIIKKEDLLSLDGKYVVELVMSDNFVPDKIYESTDSRELALLVNSIIIN